MHTKRVLGLLGLLVVLSMTVPAMGVAAAAPAAGTAPGNSDSGYLAANPELLVARGSNAPGRSESAYLAANPELRVARSYRAAAQSEDGYLAANPELSIARRYTCDQANAGRPATAYASCR